MRLEFGSRPSAVVNVLQHSAGISGVVGRVRNRKGRGWSRPAAPLTVPFSGCASDTLSDTLLKLEGVQAVGLPLIDALGVMARGRVELPTPRFSVACSTN